MREFVRELFGFDDLVERVRAWIGGADTSTPATTVPSRGVALFLRGRSIRQVAAQLAPGVGGPQIIVAQDAIEKQIRAYIAQLQRENQSLREAAAALQGEES